MSWNLLTIKHLNMLREDYQRRRNRSRSVICWIITRWYSVRGSEVPVVAMHVQLLSCPSHKMYLNLFLLCVFRCPYISSALWVQVKAIPCYAIDRFSDSMYIQLQRLFALNGPNTWHLISTDLSPRFTESSHLVSLLQPSDEPEYSSDRPTASAFINLLEKRRSRRKRSLVCECCYGPCSIRIIARYCWHLSLLHLLFLIDSVRK